MAADIIFHRPNGRLIPANDPNLDALILELLHQLAELIDNLHESSPTHKHVVGQLRYLHGLLDANRGYRQ